MLDLTVGVRLLVFNAAQAAWNWNQAWEVALAGMGTALVLTIIMVGIMRLLQVAVTHFNKTDKTHHMEKKKPPVVDARPMGAEESTQGALVAAISAALHTYGGGEQAYRILKVSAVESGGGPSPWISEGRRGLINGAAELEQVRRRRQREKV